MPRKARPRSAKECLDEQFVRLAKDVEPFEVPDNYFHPAKLMLRDERYLMAWARRLGALMMERMK